MTNKWLKYKVASDFGVVDQEIFDNIMRYDIREYPGCFDKILNYPNNSEFNFHRVVFVSQTGTQNQPCSIGLNKQKFEAKYNSLIDKSMYKEIWHQRNVLSDNCFCGRLLPTNQCGGGAIVELLTSNNFRAFSQIPDVPGYVRMERANSDAPFKVKQVIAKTVEGGALTAVADIIARKLAEKHTLKFKKFAEFIKNHGADTVSFDFTFSDNKIRFFDWDCGNEETVLASIRSAQKIIAQPEQTI